MGINWGWPLWYVINVRPVQILQVIVYKQQINDVSLTFSNL